MVLIPTGSSGATLLGGCDTSPRRSGCRATGHKRVRIPRAAMRFLAAGPFGVERLRANAVQASRWPSISSRVVSACGRSQREGQRQYRLQHGFTLPNERQQGFVVRETMDRFVFDCDPQDLLSAHRPSSTGWRVRGSVSARLHCGRCALLDSFVSWTMDPAKQG